MNMIKIILGSLSGLLLLNSCTQYQAQGAGVGALGGAAVGALAGNDSRDVARGAVIGAALGTGITAAQENARRRETPPPGYYQDGGYRDDGRDGGYRDDGYRNDGYRDDYRQDPPARSAPRQDYPYAERTGNSNRVISPYAPYNVIDVDGFRSGQLAKDPSNGKIFRVP